MQNLTSSSSALSDYQKSVETGWEDLIIYDLIQKYPLDDIIDNKGNTILHLMAQNSLDVITFNKALKSRKFTTIDPLNTLDQTPLEIASFKGVQLYVQILLSFGANPSKIKQDVQVPLIPIDNIIEIAKSLKFVTCYGNLLKIIDTFSKEGIDLDNPLDEKNNTLLHLLIMHDIDSYVLDIFLRNNKIDLTRRNLDGQTSLMIAVKKKAGDSQSVLLQHGARINTCHKDIEPSCFQELPSERSVYSKLLDYTEVVLSEHKEKDKTDVIFEAFSDFISKANWEYNTENLNHNYNLLSQRTNGNIPVNCIGLSYALLHVFFAHGIHDVELHSFESTGDNCVQMSIPKTSAGLFGQFKCFDGKINEELKSKGSLLFSRHCVVRRKDTRKYYDPTFCCSYLDENITLKMVPAVNQVSC